jgi:hypothetical protein
LRAELHHLVEQRARHASALSRRDGAQVAGELRMQVRRGTAAGSGSHWLGYHAA